MIGHQQPAASSRTSGTTLAEVLISMMILGIGVVSLASLFPVGMIYSIRATQLTHATMLRDNCEAILDVIPDIIHDPDRDGNYVEHNNSVYVIDPWGWASFNRQKTDQQNASQPVTVNPDRFPPAVNGPNLRRFHANFFNENLALSLVGLPDSWGDSEGTARAELLGLQFDRVKVSPKFNLFDVQQDLLTSSVRVFLVDPSGRQSRVRTVTSVQPANGIITWSASQRVPPSAFGRLTEVRVERQDVKYTWILTVRKPYFPDGLARATVDVVVFFKRPLTINNELWYQAAQANVQGQPPRRTMRVSYVDNDTKPNLRRGTFLFDPDNGQWYRVEQVIQSNNTTFSDLLVDRDIMDPVTRVMAPQGIVAVFPLGTK